MEFVGVPFKPYLYGGGGWEEANQPPGHNYSNATLKQ